MKRVQINRPISTAPCKFRGFTITEMMVILAITTLLAALLFPIFWRQKQNAYKTTCSSNLRQIYIGFQNYTQDNDGRLPHFRTWQRDLTPYIKNNAIFRCPAVNARVKSDINYAFEFTRLNVLSTDAKGRFVWSGAAESALPFTANFYMMSDGVGEDKFNVSRGSSEFIVYEKACGTHGLGPLSTAARHFPTYHLGGGNYLFIDGHVKWLTPIAAKTLECEAGGWRPR